MFHPFSKVILKPRSETIIRAAINQNRDDIVRTNEPTPEVYIGNCLVKPEKYTCPVSVINTTDKEVQIQTPFVTLEKVERDTVEMHAIQAIKNRKPIFPRVERIWQLLRVQHLNSEEKQVIKRICEDYQDIFKRRTVNKYSNCGPRNKHTCRHCTGERETVSSSKKT